MWPDPSSKMAYGNQWMNPAFYKNMNNDQGKIWIMAYGLSKIYE